MAVLFQPRMALKMPQPPPPLSSGLQHYKRRKEVTRCQLVFIILESLGTGYWMFETYVDVPNDLVDIVGAGAIAQLLGIAANDIVPFLLLKVPDGAGEQTGRYKVEQTSRNHEENLHMGGRAAPEKENGTC